MYNQDCVITALFLSTIGTSGVLVGDKQTSNPPETWVTYFILTKDLSHDLSIIFGPTTLCFDKSKNNKLGRHFAWTVVALKMPPDN